MKYNPRPRGLTHLRRGFKRRLETGEGEGEGEDGTESKGIMGRLPLFLSVLL